MGAGKLKVVEMPRRGEERALGGSQAAQSVLNENELPMEIEKISVVKDNKIQSKFESSEEEMSNTPSVTSDKIRGVFF